MIRQGKGTGLEQSEQKEEARHEKTGWIKAKEGEKERERCRGPEGEPISARMGSLVYISSFISHPALLFEDF